MMKNFLCRGVVLLLAFCAVPFTSWLSGNDIFLRGIHAVAVFWASVCVTAIAFVVFEMFRCE